MVKKYQADFKNGFAQTLTYIDEIAKLQGQVKGTILCKSFGTHRDNSWIITTSCFRVFLQQFLFKKPVPVFNKRKTVVKHGQSN